MSTIDASAYLSALREAGNDNFRIEVKDASGGLPRELENSLSAFGNAPEGGLIILGIAENDGAFDVTGVWDSKKAESALANKARQRIVPPLQLGAVDTSVIEGKRVVICVVPPQSSDRKPFRVGVSGPAYIRSADGDYQLDDSEVQLLINQRAAPVHDRAPVLEASVERHLDKGLVDQYLTFQLNSARRLAQLSRDEQLIHTNVVDETTGCPTVAAVYALGIHPQKFFPALSVKAVVAPRRDDPTSVRLRDSAQFSGPVPDLLDETLQWVEKRLTTSIVFRGGHGRDEPELPAVAVREVIANALVHRDLSPASMSSYIQLTKREDKLVVSNPGGLWGLTERQLGKTGPSPRNPVLYDMCRAIRTMSGNRIIEASATGIPAIRQSLHDAFLPAPYFKDRSIAFDAILTTTSMLTTPELEWLQTLPGEKALTTAQRHALIAMRSGERVTNSTYREAFPMDSTEARAELQQLVEFGIATAQGQAGGTTYQLADSSVQPPPPVAEGSDKPRRYLSNKEKIEKVLGALRASAEPLSRSQLVDATGLTAGQLGPTLRDMRNKDLLTFTAAQSNSRNQTYALGPKV